VQSVVMMGFSMNQTLMRTSASPVASGIAGMGYLRMAVSAVAVAEFIRTQGYWAIPSTNCTAANVPIAIQAGLGEDGRHGVLVTPEFGASLRLSKVFTNMPMVKAKAISFGLKEFCDSCGKCANDCPADALTTGPRSWEAIDECNNPGAFKYYNSYKKCLRYWMENGCSCSTCVATCQGDLWAYGNISRDPAWLAENMDFVNDYWAARSSEPGYWRGVAEPSAVWDMELAPYGLHQYSEHFKSREEFKNRLRSYQRRK
jgi:reductive dehalogenase